MFAALLAAAHEWARLVALDRTAAIIFYVLLALACFFSWGAAEIDRLVFIASIFFWIAVVPAVLWFKPSFIGAARGVVTGIVILYPMWLAMVRLQTTPALLLALLAIVWISDSAAYGAGHAVGRHKLAPLISPGKTWEGVGGAFVAVTVYAAAFSFWWFPESGFAFVFAAFSTIMVLGILGDLFESLIKRSAGVKDSGVLLPGHGGVLDRIDAITATLPLAAFLFAK
jgi:phosphatidate cytidylyltransferase